MFNIQDAIFQDINLFGLNIPFYLILGLLLLLIGISLFVIIYVSYEFSETQKTINKKGFKNVSKFNTKKKITVSRELPIMNKMKKIFNAEHMEMHFVHCNYALGIKTFETYVIYKALFTIVFVIAGIQMFDPTDPKMSFVYFIGYVLVGFFIVDIVLKQEKKKRLSNIRGQLTLFLINFDNYSKAGLLFEDILDVMSDILDGSFKEEMIRFNVDYSMTKNFEESIMKFSTRLGCEEVDEIELKIRQAFYSGIYDDVFSDQKEILEKKVASEMKKEADMFQIYSAIAMGLILVNIFLLIVLPLFSIASNSYSSMMAF